MAEIVSANVGGAVAGGITIPQPVAAGYATWPDILKKETMDVLAILNASIARGGDDPNADNQAGSQSSAPAQVAVTAGLFTLPVILLVVAIVIIIRS